MLKCMLSLVLLDLCGIFFVLPSFRSTLGIWQGLISRIVGNNVGLVQAEVRLHCK